jgi:hypothetical protein
MASIVASAGTKDERALSTRTVALFLSALISVALLLASRPAAAQTQAAVEYYYADWDYYFETSFSDEIALLDGGAFGGVWKRTGQTFTVWPQQLPGTSAACRFFSTSFAPKSSHFYTPFDAECAQVKNNPNWQYEAIAFYMRLPNAAGVCPAGTKVLYRLYNNGMGGAPNHRYTTSLVIFNQMKAAGWIFEGNGNTGAFACVPIFDAQGYWTGTTATGAALYGIVLDDASYYFIYILPHSQSFDGFVYGTATSSNGQFNSSDGRNFVSAAGVVPTTLAGPYVPKTSMSGTVSSALGNDAYTLLYNPSYEQPVNIASIVGTYSGTLGTADAVMNAVVTVDGNGVLAGTFGNCSLTGSVTPRPLVSAYDLLIATEGATCTFGGKIQHSGLVAYDPVARRLFVLAPNPGRNNGIMFVGTKP